MSNMQMYLLSLFHTVSCLFERFYYFTQKTVQAMIDAHSSCTWVFSERNTVPWCLKDSVGMKNYVYPIMYNPLTQLFVLPSRVLEECSKFDDVVVASLVNSDKILNYDMSSFFHSVSWEAGKGRGPSLYEVVLVFCLSKDLVFTRESMQIFYLDVYTIEGKNYHIKLSEVEALNDFISWNAFNKYVVEDDVPSVSPSVAPSTTEVAVLTSVETPAPVA